VDNGDGDTDLRTHGWLLRAIWSRIARVLSADGLSRSLAGIVLASLARIGLVEAEKGAAQTVVVIGYENTAGKLERHIVAQGPVLRVGCLRIANGKAGLLLGCAAVGLV